MIAGTHTGGRPNRPFLQIALDKMIPLNYESLPIDDSGGRCCLRGLDGSRGRAAFPMARASMSYHTHLALQPDDEEKPRREIMPVGSGDYYAVICLLGVG